MYRSLAGKNHRSAQLIGMDNSTADSASVERRVRPERRSGLIADNERRLGRPRLLVNGGLLTAAVGGARSYGRGGTSRTGRWLGLTFSDLNPS